MSKAYSYIRFSSEKQASGDSLRRQTEKARAFIERRKDLGLELDVSLSLSDPAMSAYKGTNLKKGALAAFLRAVDAGEIAEGSYLLVESFDRLSRQQSSTSIRLLLDLVESGVVVVTLNDERVYDRKSIAGADGAFTLMLSLVSMARAHDESATKGMRVKAAWQAKMERVEKGQQLTKKVPFWLNSDLTLRPEKVDLVREIFHLYSAGYGPTKLSKLLNGREEPTASGKGLWGPSTLRKLITGKQVLGILTTANGKSHEGYFPAVISEEQWLTANAMTGSGRATKAAATPKPLQGLVWCACGSTMRHQGRTGRLKKDGTRNRWDYLCCSKAAVGAGCVFVSIPQKLVLERLAEEIPWFRISAPIKDDRTVDLGVIKARISMAEEDRDRAYEVYKVSRTVATRDRVAEMEKQLAALQYELERLYALGGDVGNKVLIRLLGDPRLHENSWWRQVVSRVVLDTITSDVKVVFHNANRASFNLDRQKPPEGFVRGIDLWERLKKARFPDG